MRLLLLFYVSHFSSCVEWRAQQTVGSLYPKCIVYLLYTKAQRLKHSYEINDVKISIFLLFLILRKGIVCNEQALQYRGQFYIFFLPLQSLPILVWEIARV